MNRTMRIKKKEWFVTFDHARIDVVLIIKMGKVAGFSLNLSITEKKKRYDVLRWDTAHGHLHKHEFWRGKKAIAHHTYAETPLDLAFRHIYNDLISNGEWYVKRWENARRGKEEKNRH